MTDFELLNSGSEVSIPNRYTYTTYIVNIVKHLSALRTMKQLTGQ